MAYGKLYKTCQDFWLGIQQVNQARDNLEAFRTAWIAEHGKLETANPYESLGRHKTPPIPRASVYVDVVATIGTARAYTVSSQPTVTGVTRISTGLWFIAMDGRLTSFWGIAHPSQAAADIRFCKPTSFFPSTAGAQAGIYVKTLSSTAGSVFAVTDFSFCCTVYGYNASDVPAAAAVTGVAKPISLPPWSPRAKRFHPGRKGR